ncbi:MAG: (2Fe-2S)-binding protein, partial [Ornithinimicrobium sp.]
MSSIEPPARLVDWTLRLENAAALDTPVSLIEPEIEALFGSGLRGSLLRGDWLGHAVHPVLTDFVLGSWTSATVLDVFGGPDSASSARKLVGAGLLVVGPTAWTGWAQWSGSERRDKRVGLV